MNAELKATLAGTPRLQVEPGKQAVSSGNVVFSTLLGSCVAACLYDPNNRVLGMNHFLLAGLEYPQRSPMLSSDAGRYGVHAMELLINEMLSQGAERSFLKAKVFGGSRILQTLTGATGKASVGETNIRFIREFLQNERIPLVAADLGGDRGRIIHFLSRDFSVHVKTLQKNLTSDLADQEHRFLRETIREHQSGDSDILIWE